MEAELQKGTKVNINSKSLVLSYKKAEYDAEVPPNLIDNTVGVDTTENAGRYLKSLMGGQKVFSYPKPISLMSYLISFIDMENEVILDFFSGSGSTAESALRTSDNVKFILVQIPELLNPEIIKDPSEKQITLNGIELLERLNRPHNICELGKERIRRAANKIAEENPDQAKDLDLGFKVFKLDTSNINEWDGSPETLEQELFDSVSNIKSDRSEDDVLYEILLKYGLDLTLPIEEKEVEVKKVYNIGYGALFVCLADNITKDISEGIGAWKEELDPEGCMGVFKDRGFKSDTDKSNAVQTLKRFGITEVKSI